MKLVDLVLLLLLGWTVSVFAHDPYSEARNLAGMNCCHGTDCAVYNGPPPERVNRNGLTGLLFDRRWFFTDSQRIDPRSLPADVRGLPHLCIGKGMQDVPRCYNWPEPG
jgi:hypothetical protein